nr:Hypothetical protein CBG17962 [Haemonchus contortus]
MVQEDINLSTALPSAPASKKGAHDPRIARFTASVLVLITIGLVQLIGQSMAVHGPVVVAQILFLFFTAFTHEWHLLHGEALTRHRRAYFDVSNVLETYQTRSRTHGHLFQPDPPTPMVTFLPDGTATGGVHEAPAEKTEFMQKRDEHYANMFQFAMQMNKELDVMEKGNTDKKEDSTATAAPASAKPPSPEPGKDTASAKKSPSSKKEGSQKSKEKKKSPQKSSSSPSKKKKSGQSSGEKKDVLKL